MTDFFPVTHKTFLVLGLARSGLATTKWLRERGATVIVSDQDPQKCASALQLGAREFHFNDNKVDPHAITALVQSPGIPLTHPVSQWAHEHGIPILTDCDLFRLAHPEATIVGITGTNGKSTTTALVGHILREAGVPVAVGGNIGMPVLSLPVLPPHGVYVWELSSYQLELSRDLSLNYVGWLNLTPDHLERHKTMAAYVRAKSKIFAPLLSPPVSIINISDDFSYRLYQDLHEKHPQKIWAVSTVHQIDKGFRLEGSVLGKAQQNSAPQEIFDQIVDFNDFSRLEGAHNYENMAVAYGICAQIGLSREIILKGIASFPGLAHRQEWVKEHNQVVFVNDSKATNAEAASKALNTFDHIFWIAGGVPKTDGIDTLEPYFSKIKHAFLIGEAQESFARTLDPHVSYTLSGDLKTAVEQAYQAAQTFIKEASHEESTSSMKAVVLLCPACASFDQFRDFEDRGNVFRTLVDSL